MVGWYVQVYADSPARLTLYFQDLPGRDDARVKVTRLRRAGAGDQVFVDPDHRIPAFTISSSRSYLDASIVTV